ncbi:hypothetical protein PR048_010135 [Dryococelus australis]|uniref:Uncharacterized protein n=1 Tax=Dryococelus australis TaxID=614101 RepID=A0ABQ9I1V5_9NEOP|nr:hypothetical protein PR048_010135 [Dryococelus australis]
MQNIIKLSAHEHNFADQFKVCFHEAEEYPGTGLQQGLVLGGNVQPLPCTTLKEGGPCTSGEGPALQGRSHDVARPNKPPLITSHRTSLPPLRHCATTPRQRDSSHAPACCTLETPGACMSRRPALSTTGGSQPALLLKRSSARIKGREKREIPEIKTRRPAASSSTTPTCENPGVTRPGIEPGSHWWEALLDVSMEQRRNEGAEQNGDPRENPPTSGIGRDYHLRKSVSDPAGNRPVFYMTDICIAMANFQKSPSWRSYRFLFSTFPEITPGAYRDFSSKAIADSFPAWDCQSPERLKETEPYVSDLLATLTPNSCVKFELDVLYFGLEKQSIATRKSCELNDLLAMVHILMFPRPSLIR